MFLGVNDSSGSSRSSGINGSSAPGSSSRSSSSVSDEQELSSVSIYSDSDRESDESGYDSLSAAELHCFVEGARNFLGNSDTQHIGRALVNVGFCTMGVTIVAGIIKHSGPSWVLGGLAIGGAIVLAGAGLWRVGYALAEPSDRLNAFD